MVEGAAMAPGARGEGGRRAGKGLEGGFAPGREVERLTEGGCAAGSAPCPGGGRLCGAHRLRWGTA